MGFKLSLHSQAIEEREAKLLLIEDWLRTYGLIP